MSAESLQETPLLRNVSAERPSELEKPSSEELYTIITTLLPEIYEQARLYGELPEKNSEVFKSSSCNALTLAFHDVLKDNGIDSTLYKNKMIAIPGGIARPEFHFLLQIETAEGPFMADLSYGQFLDNYGVDSNSKNVSKPALSEPFILFPATQEGGIAVADWMEDTVKQYGKRHMSDLTTQQGKDFNFYVNPRKETRQKDVYGDRDDPFLPIGEKYVKEQFPPRIQAMLQQNYDITKYAPLSAQQIEQMRREFRSEKDKREQRNMGLPA